MPWKECHVEDERLRFVARLLDGEKMAPLCAEFGISRKTGYKIYDRYKDVGLHGLTDRSRRPYRHANQLPLVIENDDRPAEAGVSRLGRTQDSGAATRPLSRRCSAPRSAPSTPSSTAMASCTRRSRRRHRADGHAALDAASTPNDLWCADYKGEFMLGNRRYCYPADDHRLRHSVSDHL